MKRTKKMVKCGCCGKNVEVPVIMSHYRRDCGLDQKPETLSLIPLIQECPECHYCSNSLEAKVTEAMKKKILSSEYHKLMEEDDASDRDFLRLQAAIVGTEDDKKSAFFNLWSAWYSEFAGSEEFSTLFRTKAVEHMDRLMENTVDMALMLIYIDCLRQLEEFEKAEEVILDIEEDVKGNLSPDHAEYKVFMFEKKLVEAKDKQAHMVSEAM